MAVRRHGLLAWGVATLATAALLGSVITGVVNGGVQAGASVAGGAATTAAAGAAAATGGTDNNTGYFVDVLFRRDAAAAGAPAAAPESDNRASSAETARILASALASGTLPPEDASYLGQQVAQRTGLSAADAQKRVSDTFTRAQAQLKHTEATAREAADKARKAASYTALWLFVSLLFGAFVASFMATHGGRRRDL